MFSQRGKVDQIQIHYGAFGSSVIHPDKPGRLTVLFVRRFAILGLTHQFMTAIIKDNDYNALVRAFTDQAAIFSPNAIATGDVSTSFPASSAQDRSIRPNQEWRFCLFRHWTLWDAMVHSSYIGGKFQLWTDRGNSNLTGLLAKIG